MFGIKKPVWVFFWSFFFFNAGLGLYINIWPNYLRRLGASPQTVGMLIGFTLLLSTISYLPGGYFSDHFDRRKMILLSWWMSVPAPLFFAWARHWTALLPGILLFYLSSFGFPVLLNYLSHATDGQEFSFALGFALNFSAIGMVLTPALGGYIAREWSFQALFYVAAAMFLVSTLVLYLLDPQHPADTKHSEDGNGSIPGSFWIFTAAACILFLGMNVFPPFIPQLLEDVRKFGIASIGSLGSAGSLGAAALAPLLGWAAGRVGLRRSLGAAILITMISVTLFLAVTSPALLVVAFFFRGGLDALRTLSMTAVGAKAPPGKRGVAFGSFNFISGLAASAGPLLGGMLYAVSPFRPFQAALVILPLAGIAVIALLPRKDARGEDL